MESVAHNMAKWSDGHSPTYSYTMASVSIESQRVVERGVSGLDSSMDVAECVSQYEHHLGCRIEGTEGQHPRLGRWEGEELISK